MKKLAELGVRALTGVFFVGAIVAAILGGVHFTSLLFALVIALACVELYKMAQSTDVKPQVFLGIINALFVFGAIVANSIWKLNLLPIIILPAVVIVVAELYRKKEQPFTNIAWTFLASIGLSVPFALLFLAAFQNGTGDFNPLFLIGYFCMLWLSDTGAYLVGVSIGKRKLFERISPKKSWEGFFGGVFFAVLGGYVISIYDQTLPQFIWITLGFVISIFGTYGDLSESMLKRSVGVKDSGNILPGHGGMMDRFDGVTLSAPLVYLILFVYQNYFA